MLQATGEQPASSLADNGEAAGLESRWRWMLGAWARGSPPGRAVVWLPALGAASAREGEPAMAGQAKHLPS